MSSTRPEVTGRRRIGDAGGPRNDETLADDLLPGAAKIASFIGQPERKTYHWLQRGYIPATKVGDLWIGSKARLRRHFAGDASTGEASQ
jgi:hypothetical protein